jgi:autotransporter-associated beta strand protein
LLQNIYLNPGFHACSRLVDVGASIAMFVCSILRFSAAVALFSAAAFVSASADASSALPQNLPPGLPGDLLLSPFQADRVWVERWGSNDAWSDSRFWRTGTQVGSHPEVNFDNGVLINNRDVYRDHLQGILPAPGVPNTAGVRVWVGTASPEATSGNDNINVTTAFTLGALTVQNVSVGAGRSFRNSGIIAFDSGVPAQPARFVQLGDEASEGADVNIRGGTRMRLDSPTEFYLLNTASRFRVRDNSQIFGTGDLILNPGDANAYTGSTTGQGPVIQRELRVEDTGRIATSGEIHIGAARLRLNDSADIINAAGIFIYPEGQLRLDRTGTVAYDLGTGPITLNSDGHLMDDDSNGALRQQAPGFADTAIVANPIVVAGDSRVHARDAGTLRLLGDISGPAELRKTGEGILRLEGVLSNAGGLNISNGTTVLPAAHRLNGVPLRFANASNVRELQITGDQTVSLLDGDSPDPDGVGAINTLTLQLGAVGTTLTVDQAMLFDFEGEETSTRFQGTIAGAGGLRKEGDGILRLTRWTNTYAGPTTVARGVLEVSASAAPVNTTSITVEAGGQLRLSTSGVGVTYDFGGPLFLAGFGRSGPVTEGEGQGIRGALRYDPGSGQHSAIISRNIILSADAGLHINGRDRSLILSGDLSGPGALNKSGGGTLVLDGFAAHGGGTEVENGRLMIGGSLAGGTVMVSEDGALGGRGTIATDVLVDGELDLLAAPGLLTIEGSLLLGDDGQIRLHLASVSPGGTLSVGGAFSAHAGATVEIEGIPAPGSYPILTAAGGYTGYESLAIIGLDGSGLEGTFAVVDGVLTLILSEPAETSFEQWIGGFDLAPADRAPDAHPANDGLSNLLKYALGLNPTESSTGALPDVTTLEVDGHLHVALFAVVRIDDPAVSVGAQVTADLVDFNEPVVPITGLDQTDVSPGFERRGWRSAASLASGAPLFIRLIVE